MTTASAENALKYLADKKIIQRNMSQQAFGLEGQYRAQLGAAMDFVSEINHQTTPDMEKEAERFQSLLDGIGLDVSWFNQNITLEAVKELTDELSSTATDTLKESADGGASIELKTPLIEVLGASLKFLVSKESKKEDTRKRTGLDKLTQRETRQIINPQSMVLMKKIRERLQLRPLNTLHKHEHHKIDLTAREERLRIAPSYTAVRVMTSVLRAIAASTIYTRQREPNSRHEAFDHGWNMERISAILLNGSLDEAAKELASIQNEYPPSPEQEEIISKVHIDLAFHLALYARAYEKVAQSMEKDYIQYLKNEVLKTDQEITFCDEPGKVIHDKDAYTVESVNMMFPVLRTKDEEGQEQFIAMPNGVFNPMDNVWQVVKQADNMFYSRSRDVVQELTWEFDDGPPSKQATLTMKP